MQINHYTDYAYRVLMYLAVNQGQRITMAEIANYYDISHEHLRKVVHRLSSLNYINTFLGKSGGMEISQPLEKINIGQVFIDFEGQDPLINCHQSNCPLRASCDLKQLFSKAQRVFISELKKQSLADLLHNTKMVNNLSKKL